MAKPGHQLLETRTCGRSESPANMPQIMEMQVRRGSLNAGRIPDRPEVRPAQRSALLPNEHQAPLPQLGKAIKMPAKLRHKLGRDRDSPPTSPRFRSFRLQASPIQLGGRLHYSDLACVQVNDPVAELADLGLVKSASAHVRVHGAAPMFKLYILNRVEAVFGFYPIAEHAVTLHGQTVPIYDLVGKEATMFHHETGDDPDSIGGQYVAQAQAWFDSMWSTVSRDRQP
jgi:hypothetical protein